MSGGMYVLWLHTVDWVNGTYLELYPNGAITRITVADGEVVDAIEISPPQKE